MQRLQEEEKMNLLFKISYGLYTLCAGDGGKESGCIINTFAQQTATPETFSVTLNKQNFTHELIVRSGECAVAVLSQKTDFDFIKRFGMQSGRDTDKFEGIESVVAKNGVRVPKSKGVLGYFALKVQKSIDMGTHTMFVLESVQTQNFADDGDALTYDYYQTFVKPKPQASADSKEKWVCKICGYVHEGPLPSDFICPICKHPASDFEKLETTATAEKIEDIKGEKTMAKFICPVCGYVHEGDSAPEKCPQCGCPGSKFIKDDGSEKVWAAEHVIGVGQGVPQDIYDGLKANFEGECTEVGMYLAMARAAHREGYPEIGLYWEKAAYEEAEHAAKFCEMLGELVSPSTKVNLQKRVEAENGATSGKFELAKRAKEEGLDAIHDTVHEMARDEARHGKAFEGLLNRYFK